MARNRRREGSIVRQRPDVVTLRRLPAFRDLSVKRLEDRREFHPQRDLRPAASFLRDSRRIVVRKPQGSIRPNNIPVGVAFKVPRDVAICVRRKERRSVLFAKGHGGKGFRSPKRRNWFSDVGC